MDELAKVNINGKEYHLKDETARQGSGGDVAYDEAQALTEEQKAQARENIGAQPAGNYLTQHQDISGLLPRTELTNAINTALAQAKDSGEFKGDAGYTPQKGVDYFDGDNYVLTEEDRNEIAEMAAELVEVPAPDTGGNATSLLAGKKIVYDGDSICESRTGGTENNGGGYAKIIADMVGGTYVNNAVSGAALTSTPSDETYHSVVDSLSALPTDGDLYCFEGGYNDFCRNVPIGTCDDSDYESKIDTSTICGAMERIFRYCLSVLIGRPACFVISHKCSNTQSANSTGKSFKDYRDAMIQVCEKYSIPYYDAFTKSGLNGWNESQSNAYLTANANGTGDGCHPNEEGYKRYYVPQLISLFESMMPTEITQSEPGVDEEPIVNLIDEVGYTDGVRLSTSSGVEKEVTSEPYTTTGFIKMESASDIYRTSGVVFDGDRYAQSIICIYEANQSFKVGGYIKPNQDDGKTMSLTQCNIVMDGNGNLTIKPTAAGVGCYFKLSGYGYGENLIVTKNQEIT